MRNLRIQLLFSHLALVTLMAIVLVAAVVNFVHLGRSIDRILKDNYKSVIAAQDMKEALERQDSAVNFFLAGQVQKARRQYEANVPEFEKAHNTEANNITERGEREIAEDIGRQYATYRKSVEKLLYAQPPLADSDANDYYFQTLEPDFVHLKLRAQDVLDLNQAAILRADRKAKAEAARASWLGAGVTISALVLALFFALRMVALSLAPLRSLARQAEEIGAGHLNQRIELDRTDEVGALAASFNHMTEKLREARQLAEERLHRAERMSDAALESLYDPVLVTDSKGNVVHLNRAAEELFGPESRAKGHPVSQIAQDRRIAEAIERAIEQEYISAAEGEAGLVTLEVGRETRTYRLRVTPMREEDDRLLGAAMVLEDITHLRELDRLKTEFIGVASHELRTPVTSLLLSVQLMEEGAVGDLTPEQREIVAAQREDLQRLEQMTRDLLDLTRLESGVTPLQMEAIPAAELVQAAAEAVAAQVEAKGLTLELEIPDSLPSVQADHRQIVRVLVNLLNNAIRHTPETGRITLTAAQEDAQVAIDIRDTGTGIPEEYLPRIFERFVQVPGATRGGAGMGLSIAQSIVRAHGGEITVQSKPNQGSVFTFRLPQAEDGQSILPDASKEGTAWRTFS